MDDSILSRAKGLPGTRFGYVEPTADKDNDGRVETRRTRVSDEVHWLSAELPGLWPGRSAGAAVECARQDGGDPTGSIDCAQGP